MVCTTGDLRSKKSAGSGDPRTARERDFIINDDINSRMGQDAADLPEPEEPAMDAIEELENASAALRQVLALLENGMELE